MSRRDYDVLQLWQVRSWDYVGGVSPLRRLHRAGPWGLPVGPGTQHLGGLRRLDALRLERNGIVYADRNIKGEIIRVYACQYSFNFLQ